MALDLACLLDLPPACLSRIVTCVFCPACTGGRFARCRCKEREIRLHDDARTSALLSSVCHRLLDAVKSLWQRTRRIDIQCAKLPSLARCVKLSRGMRDVQELGIRGRWLTEESSVRHHQTLCSGALATLAAGMRQLRRLSLISVGFGDEDFAALAHSCPSLEMLHLSCLQQLPGRKSVIELARCYRLQEIGVCYCEGRDAERDAEVLAGLLRD